MSRNTLKTFRIFLLVGLVVLFCTFSATGFAKNTYNEPAGRFTIDLPDGYKLEPQKNAYVYQFEGQGPGIMMVFFPDKNEREMYETGLGLMRKPMPDAVLQDNVVEMFLNGNLALWGVYKGTVQTEESKTRATLYASVGGVMLKSGGLMFYTTYGVKKRMVWSLKLKSAFYSVRNVNTPVTGAKNVRAVKVE